MAPSPGDFELLHSDTIASMSDTELIRFADERYGLVIEPGTKRTAIESKLIAAAQYAYDS